MYCMNQLVVVAMVLGGVNRGRPPKKSRESSVSSRSASLPAGLPRR